MTVADDSVNLKNLKKHAVSLGDATMKGDHAFVIYHTYDNVLKDKVGRMKLIWVLDAGMKLMLDKGVKITSYWNDRDEWQLSIYGCPYVYGHDISAIHDPG